MTQNVMKSCTTARRVISIPGPACVTRYVRTLDLHRHIVYNLVQILTRQPPFHEYLRDVTVTYKVSSRCLPSRPPLTSSAWNAWGLTEAIWKLMEDCWAHEQAARPEIGEVIARLSSLGKYMTGRLETGDLTCRLQTFETLRGGQSYSSWDDAELIISEFVYVPFRCGYL